MGLDVMVRKNVGEYRNRMIWAQFVRFLCGRRDVIETPLCWQDFVITAVSRLSIYHPSCVVHLESNSNGSSSVTHFYWRIPGKKINAQLSGEGVLPNDSIPTSFFRKSLRGVLLVFQRTPNARTRRGEAFEAT
jgi:hypothetical protein